MRSSCPDSQELKISRHPNDIRHDPTSGLRAELGAGLVGSPGLYPGAGEHHPLQHQLRLEPLSETKVLLGCSMLPGPVFCTEAVCLTADKIILI